MVYDTRYARCAGIGEATLSMLQRSAKNALDMIEKDGVRGEFEIEYVKSSLRSIITESQTSQDRIAEIKAEPNPELTYGEGA